MWPAWLLAMITGHFLGVRIGVLAAFLAVAVYYDWTSRKIPNAIVLSGAGVALLLQTLWPDGLGLIPSLEGLGLGLALLLPLYMLKGMGAGDVKLMAMTGAFLGPSQTFGAVLGTFIVGLFLGLAFAAKAHALARLLANLKFMLFGSILGLTSGQSIKLSAPAISVGKMPYALAIAIGTLCYLGLPWARHALAR